MFKNVKFSLRPPKLYAKAGKLFSKDNLSLQPSFVQPEQYSRFNLFRSFGQGQDGGFATTLLSTTRAQRELRPLDPLGQLHRANTPRFPPFARAASLWGWPHDGGQGENSAARRLTLPMHRLIQGVRIKNFHALLAQLPVRHSHEQSEGDGGSECSAKPFWADAGIATRLRSEATAWQALRVGRIKGGVASLCVRRLQRGADKRTSLPLSGEDREIIENKALYGLYNERKKRRKDGSRIAVRDDKQGKCYSSCLPFEATPDQIRGRLWAKEGKSRRLLHSSLIPSLFPQKIKCNKLTQFTKEVPPIKKNKKNNAIDLSLAGRTCLPVMERFFGTMKSERVNGKNYATRAEAKSDIIDFIELFYNTRRLHSA